MRPSEVNATAIVQLGYGCYAPKGKDRDLITESFESSLPVAWYSFED